MRVRDRVLFPTWGSDPDGRYNSTFSKIVNYGGWDYEPENHEQRLLTQYSAPRTWLYRQFVYYVLGKERIEDVDSKYFKVDKPVYHRQLGTMSLAYARAEADLRYYQAAYNWKWFFSGAWHMKDSPSSAAMMDWNSFSNYASSFENLITLNVQAEAYWTMRPYMEAKVSMANFLFELKDFTDIVNIFGKSSFWKSVDKLRHTLTRLGQDSLKRNVKTLARVDWAERAAEARLAYNFAIVPTISDVRDICESLTMSVEKAQADAKANADGTTRHFTKNLVTESSLSQDSRSANLYYAQGDMMSAKYTASMQFAYHFKALERAKAFAQFWGLSWDPEKIWNALPLSFVVDYVFGIGKALHVMRKDPQISDLTASSYTQSYKFLSTRGTHIYSAPDWNGTYYNCGYVVDGKYHHHVSRDKATFTNGHRFKYYKRWLGKPYCGPYLPELHGMKRSHMLNMVALAKVML